MANSQIVKRYTTNKICCLATNTVKTDRKIRYGSTDALCCVAKDFRAQVFLKMMQCSPEIRNTEWYSGNITIEYTSKTPREYDFATPLIINSGSITLNSYDGTQSTTPLNFSGDYGVLPNIDAVKAAFAKRINSWGTSQTTNTFFAFADVIKAKIDGSPNLVSVDIYHDSTWGNNKGRPLSTTDISGGKDVPFDSETEVTSYEEDNTIVSSACFTEAQLCAMKRVIDDYCKNCN